MYLNKMIELLNGDLSNEYAHWNFYIHSAAVVTGLHREELSEFFFEEAKSEMEHVLEFKKLILGIGGVPTTISTPIRSDLRKPNDIIKCAYELEEEVVRNYVQRMDDAESLEKNDKVAGRYIHIFLEDQILDSRKAVDHYREMLK